MKIEVERTPASVIITIQCVDEYETMLTYDKIIEELKHGAVTITFITDKGLG